LYILVLSLICALIIAVFAVQNAAPVVIRFFWTTANVPLVLVILGSALTGALITLLLAVWREYRRRRLTLDAEDLEQDTTQATTGLPSAPAGDSPKHD